MAQLVEQLIRNQQVAGSSPASSSKGRDNLCLLFFSLQPYLTAQLGEVASASDSSKICVNTAFSQVFSFSEMNFKTRYATKNLTLFYKVRFCSLIRFFVQDHLLTIYECTAFPPSKLPIVFATFFCMEPVAIL